MPTKAGRFYIICEINLSDEANVEWTNMSILYQKNYSQQMKWKGLNYWHSLENNMTGP